MDSVSPTEIAWGGQLGLMVRKVDPGGVERMTRLREEGCDAFMDGAVIRSGRGAATLRPDMLHTE